MSGARWASRIEIQPELVELRVPSVKLCNGTVPGQGAQKGLSGLRLSRWRIILTSNKSYGDWGTVFGDPIIAILDRPLHHSVLRPGNLSVKNEKSFGNISS